MTQSNFMGKDGFVWFVGVVEDRNDPDFLGRIRVRCLGYHTDDQGAIPTADLPWAHVMHPITDPSMHGMGSSPSFLVEGSWVIGFFRDSAEKQQPVIIGSLPGVPQESANFLKGFNDPRHAESTQVNDGGQRQYSYKPEDRNEYGPYPLGALVDTSDETKGKFSRFSGHTVGEPDTNRLARGVRSETHGALARRRKQKQTKIPISTKPNIKTVSDDLKTDETRSTWDEPDPKGLKSDASPYTSAKYPLNHVYESESGHIHEIDDTPGGERLHREHKSGTFEEIHPDGSMVTKIVKDNYAIVMGSESVYISGTVNLTIGGNCRQLIKGDYVLEVEGNYTEKIGKNHQVKVGYGKSGGNREEEVMGNHSWNIHSNIKARVGEDVDTLIEGNESRTVNGIEGSDLYVRNNIFSIAMNGNHDMGAKTNITASTQEGLVSIKAGDKINMKSAKAMHIKTEADGLTIDSTGAVTENFSAGQDTNITGDWTCDTTGNIELNNE